MKARTNPFTARQEKLMREAVEREYKKVAQKERDDLTRRIFKTILCVLHTDFGFGRQRLMKALSAMSALAKQADTDDVFWEHIDALLIDELGIPFERDFTENGQVISEKDYYGKD